MSAVIIIGAQWGDEGKGKITDYLAEKAQMIVRYQGGNNAGHTVVIEDQVFKLHLIPSGIFYKEKRCVIGNGVVIDPAVLLRELEGLKARGIGPENLKISSNAHIIMPYHKELDELEEEAKGAGKLGTTKRGIGPAYRDKVSRTGVRMMDLLNEAVFREKLQENVREKNLILTKIYEREPLRFADIHEEYMEYGKRLAQYVCDTGLEIHRAMKAGQNVLFEGAQGILLDLDHGTYPYVTSSNPVAGGACVGAGIGPTAIKDVVGVLKAYTTRVGEGPFPTELNDEVGETLRQNGGEFGTTTGRPRRCGWFDAVVAGYSARVSGLSYLALTKLDVLSGLKSLKICTGYRFRGEVIHDFPQDLETLALCEPVYEELPGWQEDITDLEHFEELPLAAQKYVFRIEEILEISVALLAVGPGRKQTIVRKEIFG